MEHVTVMATLMQDVAAVKQALQAVTMHVVQQQQLTSAAYVVVAVLPMEHVTVMATLMQDVAAVKQALQAVTMLVVQL